MDFSYLSSTIANSNILSLIAEKPVKRIVLDRTLVLVMAPAISLIIGLGFYADETSNKLANKSSWVKHTVEVLGHLKKVSALLILSDDQPRLAINKSLF